MKPYRIEARILPLMHLNHDSYLARASCMQDWLGKRCIQTYYQLPVNINFNKLLKRNGKKTKNMIDKK